MNALKSRIAPRMAARSVVVSFVLSASVFAQSAAAPATPVKTPVASPAANEVPDGAPQLAPEKVISNTSTAVSGGSQAGRSTTSVIVNEERIQGRLASASVSVGGAKGYMVVDPDAGRADRQPSNGGKRLSPSLWELFRF